MSTRRAALIQLASSAVLAALFDRSASAETTTYVYDVHGRVIKVTFANGDIVQYSYDNAGNRTQVARVNGPPSINSFTASPSTINSGNSSTLSWATTNASSVSINNGIGTVPPNGSEAVSPSTTTTYTLTASGPGGSDDTEPVTVTVVGGFNQTIQITGASAVNLRTLANNAGYNGAQNATVTFEVGNGVTITGAAGAPSGGIAIDSGTWPTGSHTITLTLVVKNGGIVRGGGGAGGDGGGWGDTGFVGSAGGDAIYCRLPMSITIESGGTAQGGGGGGGGGASANIDWGGEVYGGGGGGGGGRPNGNAGSGGAGDYPGSGGTGGSPSANGSGGAGGTDGILSGGDGGNGGNFGSAGSAGSGPVAGGAAGYCIRKNGHTVPVTNNGATAGTIG